jgi:hypothetical protein
MDNKPKSPSIRALQELKEAMENRCAEKHGHKLQYSSDYDNSKAKEAIDKFKEEILSRVSKEAEKLIVEKYKEYGVAIVPVCHRDSTKEDRLNVQLKVTVFPGIKTLEAAKKKADEAYAEDRKKISTWYYDSLRAIASREKLPDMPDFKV